MTGTKERFCPACGEPGLCAVGEERFRPEPDYPKCSECGGTGGSWDAGCPLPCPACDGTGDDRTEERFRALAAALYTELVDAWNNGFDSGHTEELLAEYDAAVADD